MVVPFRPIFASAP